MKIWIDSYYNLDDYNNDLDALLRHTMHVNKSWQNSQDLEFDFQLREIPFESQTNPDPDWELYELLGVVTWPSRREEEFSVKIGTFQGKQVHCLPDYVSH